MLSSIINFIVIDIIYRPFFNVLILVYDYLPWGEDMGLALIIFTLFINICLLPLTLSGEDTDEERRQLMQDMDRVEKIFAGYPVRIKKEKETHIRAHRKIIGSRLISYAIYVAYFIVLYRVFKTGIKGEDFNLLYSFVRQPEIPVQTNFLGLLELTVPSPLFNAASAILTVPAELLGIMFSDLPATREDWMTVVFAPIAAFFITYRVPAGQELYFTVSLIFIIVVMITREVVKIFVRRNRAAG
ncbi:YidC/Oxa1 family membrane protein insertase [Patescibacteria group bacterium]|nr:YidC/Oxa1 family membrane protein insertase [Patescibacteria group bacterium]MBU1868479.1 YidC/Oxa1 family membrane protein insertase [Patescibacteria group bacterium]